MPGFSVPPPKFFMLMREVSTGPCYTVDMPNGYGWMWMWIWIWIPFSSRSWTWTWTCTWTFASGSAIRRRATTDIYDICTVLPRTRTPIASARTSRLNSSQQFASLSPSPCSFDTGAAVIEQGKPAGPRIPAPTMMAHASDRVRRARRAARRPPPSAISLAPILALVVTTQTSPA